MVKISLYDEYLSVGIIQTTVDGDLAWPKGGMSPKMTAVQDSHVWEEICKAMRAFVDGAEKPKLVVLPELSLPRTRINDFEKLVCSLNVIAIVGIDYKLDHVKKVARNQGLVFVPQNFFKSTPSHHCTQIMFGKSYGAPGETKALAELTPSWSFVGDEDVYLFDLENYGKVGLSICYDFMDLERALLYRGRIHHLFVIAYNRDLGMFQSLANSLSRTIFCNVVVCNTGIYGGSTVVSPYYEAYKRTLYAHNGKDLFTTQVIKLPIKGIADAMAYDYGSSSAKQEFKHPPPGL